MAAVAKYKKELENFASRKAPSHPIFTPLPSLLQQSTMGAHVVEPSRLWLEPLNSEEHFEDYYAIQSHPLAMFWSSQTVHTTREQSLAQMESMRPSVDKPWNERWAIMLRPMATEAASPNEENGAVKKPKPKMIGFLGIVRQDEIGYKLHPDFWGNGYMSEALALFIDLFWKWDAMKSSTRLIAAADSENKGSLRVLEKAGFIKDRYEKEFYERAIDQGKGGKKRDLQFFYLDRPQRNDGTSN
ncbi:uncharacterized protein BP5553_05841 [Venustampulla echinocandica]|uniref:N-acetyltransferase domain-containing protein n=1 Tax=Venustampulla echinocandica TaxID=2656787 RepID=A0A370TLU7_9HELO|nr:uncharacterized protein BP5553_05841 [Venustampulla echinocandica]RDL36489.1 hypothetical protein BP5553_05841 [Venustampulla echinocandica]